MEELDRMLYLTLLGSTMEAKGEIISEYTAKMSILEAVISG